MPDIQFVDIQNDLGKNLKEHSESIPIEIPLRSSASLLRATAPTEAEPQYRPHLATGLASGKTGRSVNVQEDPAPVMATINIRRRFGVVPQGLPRSLDDDDPNVSSAGGMTMLYISAILGITGVSEMLMAFAYGHLVGMTAGFIAVAASLLIQRNPEQAVKPALRTFLILWLTYVILLVGIRLISIRPELDFQLSERARELQFPRACGSSKLEGCARVANESPHPDDQVAVPRFTVHVADVVRTVEKWASKSQAKVLLKRWEAATMITNVHSKCAVFFHIRALTVGMGFADDMFVNVECIQLPPSGTKLAGQTAGQQPRAFVQVSVQSQLRIGKLDFGTNGKRISHFIGFLKANLEIMPRADCTRDLGLSTNIASF